MRFGIYTVRKSVTSDKSTVARMSSSHITARLTSHSTMEIIRANGLCNADRGIIRAALENILPVRSRELTHLCSAQPLCNAKQLARQNDAICGNSLYDIIVALMRNRRTR